MFKYKSIECEQYLIFILMGIDEEIQMLETEMGNHDDNPD